MHHSFINADPRGIKQLFELSPDPIWIIDGNQFVECNDAAVKTLGYSSRGELLNVHPSRFSPPKQQDGEDSYAKAERMMAIAKDRGLHRFEWTYTKADGTDSLAEVTLSLLEPEGRGLIYCVWRDVTERRRAEEAERRYRLLFEQANDGIFLQDAAGFIDCNQRGAQMYGLTRDEVRGRSPAELCPEMQPGGKRSAEVAAEKIEAAVRGETPRFEWVALRADGTHLDVEVSLSQVEMAGGHYLQAIVRDITERKKAELQLRESEQHFRTLANGGSTLIWTSGVDKLCNYFNEPWLRFTGRTLEQELGNGWSEGVHPDDFDKCVHTYVTAFDQRIPFSMDYRLRYVDGSYRWIRDDGNPRYDSQGQFLGYIGFCVDVTQQKAAEDQIKSLAFYDPLTNLPNRRLMLDRLEKALAASSRHGREGALLFIDLDNFKAINDTRGHDIGDLLLQQVAQVLETCIRLGDTVSRWGGDEFVVMLEYLDQSHEKAVAQARAVGEKILSALSQVRQLEGLDCVITPSIGIALFKGQKDTVIEILKQADNAMYKAKREGRNALRFF